MTETANRTYACALGFAALLLAALSVAVCFGTTVPACLGIHDFDLDGHSNGVINIDDFDGFAQCFNAPDFAPQPGCEVAPVKARSTTPETGLFTLHGRPIEVLPDGKVLMDFRTRIYDPQHGRWLQRDRAGYADGPNLYESFRHNAQRFTDPLGLFDPALMRYLFELRYGPHASAFLRHLEDRSIFTVSGYRDRWWWWDPDWSVSQWGTNVGTIWIRDALPDWDAAEALFNALNDSDIQWHYRRWMQEQALEAGDLDAYVAAYQEHMRVGLQQGAAFAAMAAELYLAGISVASEGADWVVTISDISAGKANWATAAAFLPLVSAGTVKIVGSSGEILGRFDTGSGAFRALSRKGEELGEVAALSHWAPPAGFARAGPAGLAPDLLKYAGNIRPKAGFTDIFIHADAGAFYVLHGSDWVKLSHRDVAKFLQSKGIRGDVRLISCNAGAARLGQDLANKLGVRVEAATSTVYVPMHSVSDPLLAPGGCWTTFVPGGGKP